jgi:hypothetical protein
MIESMAAREPIDWLLGWGTAMIDLFFSGVVVVISTVSSTECH